MSGRHPSRLREPDTRAHPLVQDALDRGFLTSGQDYHVPGLPSHAVANQSRIAVSRALAHFNLPKACWVVDSDGKPCFRACQDPAAPHGVAFRLYTKNAARAHVMAKTGGDPNKLKYNPFARKLPAPLDDDGRPR